MMKLDAARVILTGAGGGIGSELAIGLAAQGARLALLGRSESALCQTRERIGNTEYEPLLCPVDLLDAQARSAVLGEAMGQLGGIDILINNAGQLSFRPFADEDPEMINRIVQLNTLVPMQLTRQVLQYMLDQGKGRIVNVGSTFGSIAFAWFAAYSTSKFGLRGFSEALRRELEDTGVGVTYVAPRAVKTKLNSSTIYRMAEAVKMNMDEPAWVADRIVEGIKKERKDIYLGFPESLFVRINALLPRLVDGAMKKQNHKMMAFAKEGMS
ncbi:MAG: SDR family oxidoreductase [Candidatus Thiodiazotropha sp.]|jgi:short-subunit dehydrogenase